MKMKHLVATALLAGFSFSASAAVTDSVMVVATEKSTGSLSAGGHSEYTRTFDVAFASVSDKPGSIDLSKACLKAQTSDGLILYPESIDAALIKGTLKNGDSVQGTVIFSSESEKIYSPVKIMIAGECDKIR